MAEDSLEKSNKMNENKPAFKVYTIRAVMLATIMALAVYFVAKEMKSGEMSPPVLDTEQAALYTPFPNVVFNLEKSNDQTREYEAAFTAYEKGEYQKAYDLFDALPEQIKTPDMYFYMGQCLVSLGRYEDAVAPLRLGGKFGSQFEYHAKYFLTIAFYEMGRLDKAYPIIQKLLDKLKDDSTANGAYWKARSEKLKAFIETHPK